MIFGGSLRDKIAGSGKAVEMSNAACMADDSTETALRRSSESWLRWLSAELGRRGDTPRSRLLGLWDALEDWFTSEEFATSPLAGGAAELRGQPHHPAHAVMAAHRRALRELLVELARAAGAADPVELAAQLQVLVEGAIAAAVIDRQAGVARTGRRLTRLVLATTAA
jgi:hypothetical protein